MGLLFTYLGAVAFFIVPLWFMASKNQVGSGIKSVIVIWSLLYPIMSIFFMYLFGENIILTIIIGFIIPGLVLAAANSKRKTYYEIVKAKKASSRLK